MHSEVQYENKANYGSKPHINMAVDSAPEQDSRQGDRSADTVSAPRGTLLHFTRTAQ